MSQQLLLTNRQIPKNIQEGGVHKVREKSQIYFRNMDRNAVSAESNKRKSEMTVTRKQKIKTLGMDGHFQHIHY